MNQLKQAWYTRQWVKILLHAAAWTLLFSLPYLLKSSYDDKHHVDDKPREAALNYFMFFADALWVGFFYLNAYLLIPKLGYKKKLGMYLLSLVGAVLFIMLCHFLYFNAFVISATFKVRNFFVFNIFQYLLFFTASAAYQLIRDKIKSDQLAIERQEENLKTELSFLRSQVSPHFMFNVLNNMVALVRLKSDQLEPTIIKLSSLMRYMLYETDEEKVLLKREIEYLQSYVDLQQQRFGKKVAVNISMKLTDEQFEIEPMLLIPFIENAFKHGTGMIENAQIDIELYTKENTLHFTVRNRYNENTIREIKDKTSGIGLVNVKRRLNLLYSDQHNLWMSNKDNWYMVSLQLNLH